MNKTSQPQNGFTLIEVLVAAVILFLVASTGLLAYNSALQTNARIAARYDIMRPVTMIVDHIQEKMRGSDIRSGTGRVGDVNFSWQADIIDNAPPPARFDPDELEFVSYNPRYQLVMVTLTLRKGEYQHRYRYKEVAWLADLTPKQG